MAIETRRMLLIPYTLEQMHTALRDPSGAAQLIGARVCRPDYLERFARGRIYSAKIHIMKENPDAWLFATYWQMVLKDTRSITGEIGFKGPPVKGEVELGYGTHEFYRSRGYMTEAVSALCQFAFSQNSLHVERIMAATEKDNYASQRVLEKCGFLCKKRHKGLLIWFLEKLPGKTQ